MEAQAITRHIRQSPRKIKVVLDEIRGAKKLDALTFHGEMDGASSYLGISSYMSAAPLNPSYKSEEYEFYLKDLNPKILIVEKNSKNPYFFNKNSPFFQFLRPETLKFGISAKFWY